MSFMAASLLKMDFLGMFIWRNADLCFPVSFAKFLRTPFTEHLRCLLLQVRNIARRIRPLQVVSCKFCENSTENHQMIASDYLK